MATRLLASSNTLSASEHVLRQASVLGTSSSAAEPKSNPKSNPKSKPKSNPKSNPKSKP